jgi:hypothetical protein
MVEETIRKGKLMNELTFTDCCFECIKNAEFVKEFNRLTGYKLGQKRTGMEVAIDKACGYDPNKEALPVFVAFVYEYVWSRLNTVRN